MNPSARNEILKLLADGKITASEAIELLDKQPAQPVAAPSTSEPDESLKAKEAIPLAEKELSVTDWKKSTGQAEPFDGITITEDDVVAPGKNGQPPRWLKIRVRELDSGRNRATVTLPLGLVNFGFGIARRFGADFNEMDNVEEIWRLIKDGERGVIVDVEDEEDNHHVQIYLD